MLSKALINNICYEKYFDYYEDLMGNVIIKNYKEERDSNIDINHFYELNKELKKEKIITNLKMTIRSNQYVQ